MDKVFYLSTDGITPTIDWTKCTFTTNTTDDTCCLSGWCDIPCSSCIPEGYELIETEEHKKQRLEATIMSLEIQVKYHSRQGAELAEELEKTKKSLAELK